MVLSFGMLAIFGAASPASAAPGDITRVSVDSSGSQADSFSITPSISDDGRYVAFYSYASNLVPNDTNAERDIFVKDRQTGTIERVNLDSFGKQATGGSSHSPSISADGRYVAFESNATGLVSNDDAYGHKDAFVKDRQTGVTEMANVDSSGNKPSGDYTTNDYGLSISADGHVAFESYQTKLVPNDTNGTTDIFVHEFEGQSGDNLAPKVDSVTPTNKTGISRTNPSIKATFSEKVDKATVVTTPLTTNTLAGTSTNVTLLNMATGVKVGATVSCDADPCNKVTITPKKALAANTKYKATITTGVKDLADNALDQNSTTTGNQPKTWTFTTAK
jgi:hypothetical protein